MIENTNTGSRNIGNQNTGHRNMGSHNTGHFNTGYSNVGNFNASGWSTGSHNTGDSNIGGHNTGHHNTGSCNTGNHNTGDWNTGNYHVGCFNTIEAEKAYYFNKLIDKSLWDGANKPKWLFKPSPTTWVPSNDMTETEKADHPSHETTKGYLRVNDLKEEWRKAFETASPEDIQAVRDLPAFDYDVFEEITGLDLGNSKKAKDNKSGIKRKNGSWCAYINNDVEEIFLGTFRTHSEAAAACQAAEKMLGHSQGHVS